MMIHCMFSLGGISSPIIKDLFMRYKHGRVYIWQALTCETSSRAPL